MNSIENMIARKREISPVRKSAVRKKMGKEELIASVKDSQNWHFDEEESEMGSLIDLALVYTYASDGFIASIKAVVNATPETERIVGCWMVIYLGFKDEDGDYMDYHPKWDAKHNWSDAVEQVVEYINFNYE